MEEIEEKKSNDYSSMRLARLFRVLEVMSTKKVPTRLIDLSKELNLPQSTVYRYVQALISEGYAYTDEESGNYALTWKVCKVSDAIRTPTVLRNIASPYLHRIVDTLLLSACLVVMEGYRTVYLSFIDSPETIGESTIRIGKNAPIHTSGSGKVLLSVLPRQKVKDILEISGMVAMTPKTITDEEAFFVELENVRKKGFAIDDEECEEGHRCVSVPILDYSGKTVAAISAFARIEDMDMDKIENVFVPYLKKISVEISRKLGYEIK